jgi:hypothetical protein
MDLNSQHFISEKDYLDLRKEASKRKFEVGTAIIEVSASRFKSTSQLGWTMVHFVEHGYISEYSYSLKAGTSFFYKVI